MNIIIKISLFLAFSFLSLQANAKLLMQGGYSHEFTVTPGGQYTNAIKLKNLGNTPQEVKIYLEDYQFSIGGKSNFSAAHLRRNTRSNSQWIHFAPNRIILQPRTEKTIKYRMQVPQNSLTGTYWSALIIEPIGNDSIESNQPKGNDRKVHMNIKQVSRHAVQIVAQVGNTGKVNLQFNNPKMKKQANKRLFMLDAYNRGTRWIKPTVWLDVHDQQGNYIGKFKGQSSRLYPNTSSSLAVDISSLKSGKYKGLFVVDGGSDAEIMATDINLTIK